MALSSSNVTNEPRSFSLGPVKAQLKTFSVANADTSGTVTFDSLQEVFFVVASGIEQSAAPTFSGNVVTLTFVDPTATRHGQIIAIGR